MRRTACAGVHPRLALSSQRERIFGNVTNFAAEYARDASERHRAAQQIRQPACNLSLIEARSGCPARLPGFAIFRLPLLGTFPFSTSADEIPVCRIRLVRSRVCRLRIRAAAVSARVGASLAEHREWRKTNGARSR